MSLKTFKPYTKSTRGTILIDRAEGLWKGKPFKPLVSQQIILLKEEIILEELRQETMAGGHKQNIEN